jgi:AraC-like DNA-binding protein
VHDRRTIWAKEPQQFVRFAAAAFSDLDQGALLRASGLPDLFARDPDARLPVAAVWRLWHAAVEATRDRALAIRYGMTTRLDQLGLFGFAVMTAPTAREAAARACRFLHLVTDSATLRLVEHRDELAIRWEREGRGELGHELANETALAQIASFVVQTAGRTAIHRICFRHAVPAAAARLEPLLGSRVAWRARHDEVVMSRTALERRPPTANAALSAYFESHLATRAASEPAPTFTARVRDLLVEALGHGEPEARRIARRLGVAERTMRRELAREATSFRGVLQTVRSEHAERMLADPRLSLTEIAFALGFSEHSAFTRAFTRWFGRSPASYRGGRSGQGDGRPSQP